MEINQKIEHVESIVGDYAELLSSPLQLVSALLVLIQQGESSYFVFSIEGVSPSSDQHVLVSVQHAPHRPLQPGTSRETLEL